MSQTVRKTKTTKSKTKSNGKSKGTKSRRR
jgi:hypothetical protein